MAVNMFGFAALRCLLVILNSMYIGLSLFLIGLVVAAHTLAYNFYNTNILVAVGVVAGFLFFVAILGLIGVLRRDQIIMFFYMVLLAISGVALFSVSVGALAVPSSWQKEIFSTTWESLSVSHKMNIQDGLNCCGFSEKAQYLLNCGLGHPPCNSVILNSSCCAVPDLSSREYNNSYDECSYEEPLLCPNCKPCYEKWENSVGQGLKTAGSLGLIFSLTQIAGILLTFRFRNLKDPRLDPRDFL